MVRPTIDLEPHKDEIISLFQTGVSPNSICSTLRDTYCLTVTSMTIRRRLETWGIKPPKPPPTTTNHTLHERLKTLVFQVGLSDRQIMTTLQAEGFNISTSTLKRLRLRLGIRRRTNSKEDQEAQLQLINRILQEEIEIGDIEDYGRVLLHQHLRRHGYMFSRYVYIILPFHIIY